MWYRISVHDSSIPLLVKDNIHEWILSGAEDYLKSKKDTSSVFYYNKPMVYFTNSDSLAHKMDEILSVNSIPHQKESDVYINELSEAFEREKSLLLMRGIEPHEYLATLRMMYFLKKDGII